MLQTMKTANTEIRFALRDAIFMPSDKLIPTAAYRHLGQSGPESHVQHDPYMCVDLIPDIKRFEVLDMMRIQQIRCLLFDQVQHRPN